MKEPILVCDLGGVLINLNVERCINRFRDLMGTENMQTVLGLGADGEGIAAVSVASRQLMADFECGRISSETFVAQVQQFCLPDTTAQDVIDAWMSMLDELPQQRLDELKRLKQQGYTLYLLSNGNDLHFNYINARYHLDAYFERMFLSQKMHLAKPDPEIFRQVNDLIADSRPIIFVDDIPANRLAAQTTVRWQTFASLEDFMFER